MKFNQFKRKTVGPQVWKRCSSCGVEKPLDSFSADKNNKDGHRGVCAACTKLQVMKRKKEAGERIGRVPLSRHQLIARHGLAVVEALDSMGDY